MEFRKGGDPDRGQKEKGESKRGDKGQITRTRESGRQTQMMTALEGRKLKMGKR